MVQRYSPIGLTFLSDSRTVSIPTGDLAWLDKTFDETTNRFDYLTGIKIFTAYLSKHRRVFDERVFCRLGMLFDHLAFKATPKKRREVEQAALGIYTYVLKRIPASYRATWGIARVYLHRNSKMALPYAKRSYRLAKLAGEKDGLRAQSVGLVYENLGKYDAALRWLKRGLRESPDDWSTNLNLVTFYRLRKQFRASRRQAILLEKLIKKEPNTFLKTHWGEKILEIIRDAGKPLPLIKEKAARY